MKNLLVIFGNFILILAAVVCTIGVVVSAFSFDIDAMAAILVWVVTAFAISLNFSFWRIKGILVLLIPTLALFIWRVSEILDGARWVIYYLTSEFNFWLFVPVLFADAQAYDYELTMFFTAVGVALAFLLSIAICLRRSALLTALFTAPIAALSFVLIFNYSAPIFLLGLLLIYFTMLISNGLSPDSFAQRGISVFTAFLLAAILMSIVYVIAPPGEHYRGQTIRSIDHRIRTIASRLGIARVRTGFGWPVAYDGRWGFDTDYVGVSGAGTRVIHDINLLEVTVNAPGVFYLRGYSMQYFDGSAWVVNSDTLPIAHADISARSIPPQIAGIYAAYNPQSRNAPEMVHISISVTGDVTRNVAYTPYFAFPISPGASSYDFHFLNVEGSILRLHERIPDLYTEVLGSLLYDFNAAVSSPDTYLQILDSTAQRLRRFAEDIGIDANASREVITEQVAVFMVGFGIYTLAPYLIPAEVDFVMYFLERSRQGFCIHYATAATMMLRALGIPARFTSGFVVTVSPHEVGEIINITDRYAHAWVEVYFDNIGWLPIEVTPPATGFGPGDGRPGQGEANPFLPGHDIWYEDPFFHYWWDDGEGIWGGEAIPVTGIERDVPTAGYVLIIRGVLIGLLAIIIIVAPFVRRTIAERRRKRHFAQEDTNASAVFAWRYINNLQSFRRSEVPPIGIEDIAMKARYSLHQISPQERDAVVEFARSFASKVYINNGSLTKFWVKYIRGL